jgi:hypothetical protein
MNHYWLLGAVLFYYFLLAFAIFTFTFESKKEVYPLIFFPAGLCYLAFVILKAFLITLPIEAWKRFKELQ